MNRFILAVSIFCFTRFLYSQSPYEKYSATDNAILGVTALGGLTSLYLDHKMEPLTPKFAATLDRNDVNPFDRPATYNLSDDAVRLSDYGLYAGMMLPLGLLADSRIRQGSPRVAYLYLETMAITGVLTELAKVTVQRIRPWVYNENVPLKKKEGKEGKKSFFSGHTSVSFAGSIFFAKVYSDYYPDSKWTPYIWGGSIALSSAVGYWRVRAGRHFATDVIVASLVGGAVAYFIPELHKKQAQNMRNQSHSAEPMMVGFRVNF